MTSTLDRDKRDALPVDLYRAEQVRELDRITIEQQQVPGFTLMRRAAKAAFRHLLAHYPDPDKITIFCGTGNNGGDGYVMASLARQYGIAVTVVQVGDAKKIKGDAKQARQLAQQDGVDMLAFSPAVTVSAGVVVDAVLGTGLAGDVRGIAADAIAAINRTNLPVLAVDIPSGLCSDSGRLLGDAVIADHTVSFIGLKQGLMTGDGPALCGELAYADLAVPEVIFEQLTPSSRRLSLAEMAAWLPPRQRTAHKGQFGHVLVAGGDRGMAGAAAMAAEAASRVGAGLVSCATRPEHVAALAARCPQVMTVGVTSGQEFEPLLARPSVVVLGPGLGQGPWGEQLFQKVLATSLPLVVDADALNILSVGRVVKSVRRDNWILTPHPGEAARLLGCSTADIACDRFAAVAELQARFGGAVILKGAGTLVADQAFEVAGLCPYGNPGMASGGMGDVLSGVLGALLAQGLSPARAARLGTCLHARAADLAAQQQGERGLVATDLMPWLRRLVNPDQ